MGRILCLDYGERRTGVAISDETKTIAQSLTTIAHQSESELIATLGKLVNKHNVELIVIGLPLSLSGKPSTRSEMVRKFGAKLGKRLHLPVELFDERFSTVSAQHTYAEFYNTPRRGAKTKDRGPSSAQIDRIAATIILENYLNRVSHRKKR
ncbi:MAG: Holliday junction resolvase RuvX [candidate division WOR-3 bacterium]